MDDDEKIEYFEGLLKQLDQMDEDDVAKATGMPVAKLIDYVFDNLKEADKNEIQTLFAQNFLVRADIEAIKMVAEKNNIASADEYKALLKKRYGLDCI